MSKGTAHIVSEFLQSIWLLIVESARPSRPFSAKSSLSKSNLDRNWSLTTGDIPSLLDKTTDKVSYRAIEQRGFVDKNFNRVMGLAL